MPRIPKGVSSGGQFAADPKTEDGSVILGPTAANSPTEQLNARVRDAVAAINIKHGDLGLTPARARKEKDRRVMEAANAFTKELPNLDEDAAFEHLYACVKVADKQAALDAEVAKAIRENETARRAVE